MTKGLLLALPSFFPRSAVTFPVNGPAPTILSMNLCDPVKKLIRRLDLERLDADLFLGSPGEGKGRLFGGFVAAQSVIGAYRTVEQGSLHSLHAYFLRPGTHEVPIRYVVYRIRDGRTFTTRNVVAYQSGEAIFDLACSFAVSEDGVSSQGPAPNAPPPEGLPQWELARPDAHGNQRQIERWIRESPVEARAADADATHRRLVWMRVKGELPDEEPLHAAFLAYASDRGLISTARYAHGIGGHEGYPASLDHSIWFHRPPRFEGWVLFSSHSPIAHGARALILGQMHARDGTHIASVSQESLVRPARQAGPREKES